MSLNVSPIRTMASLRLSGAIQTERSPVAAWPIVSLKASAFVSSARFSASASCRARTASRRAPSSCS